MFRRNFDKFLCISALLSAGAAVCPCAGQQSLPSKPAGENPTVSTTSTAPSSTQAEPAKTEAPGEIYKAAMHPLDVVRSSLDNWSEAELGALSVGIHKARDACETAKPESYSGDDLYDLVRLCALGQDWNRANSAAQAYLVSKLEAHRAQVYALSINALVHMNAIDLALETTREMLGRLPYDAEVAYAVRYMKDYLEQQSNPGALQLAKQEHTAIVAALSQGIPLKAANGDAVMSVGALYESALELAFWERYAGDDAGAATVVADVDRALPPNMTLNAEDTARVEGVRKRYGLLGARLPEVKTLRALESPTAKVQLTADENAITVLVLFPDWCGGCRKMMKPLTEFARANKDTPIHAYGLVFEDDSVIPLQAAHDELLREMKGTSTLVVPPSTPQSFGASDFPLGVVLDEKGRVRSIGTLPTDAFNGDGYVEKTIVKITAAEPSVGMAVSDSRKK